MTDIPEPAEAPAVDDELLRELGSALYRAGVCPGPSWQDHARKLLASEPMQRLRAAWTADLQTEINLRGSRIRHVERERDEAYRQKTEWQATAGRLAAERDTLKVKVEVLQIEGDEARAELGQALHWRDCEMEEKEAAHAEVERLRAAQQLPDAKRTGSVDAAGGVEFEVDGLFICVGPDTARDIRIARARLAAAQTLDAEADNTSRDDEAAVRHALDCVQSFINEHSEYTGDDVVRCAARAALQHRARGGQEAGRG